MSAPTHTNASLRKMISVLLLIGLLSLLLVLYFLKYVPDQRGEFHREAFLELGQIQKALQTRNTGFLDAIKSTVESTRAGDMPGPLLAKNFKFNSLPKPNDSIKASEMFESRGIAFDQDNSSGAWTLNYLLGKQKSTDTLASLSKDVDSLLKPIVATYKDIFSDYVLILDTSTNLYPEKPDRQNAFNHKGRVIFNSGRLSVDFLVDLDTLLKKTDGFSLLNIHNVRIEGNPYRLFLYPIQIGHLQVVLGGLISESRYKEGSEAVPLDLITIGSFLALLLLLNLPLLKIYIIGPMERITGFDIRMIIITYFLAAFMTFFVLAAYFLSHVQTETAHSGLSRLSCHIDSAYQNEIGLVHKQLETYDLKYNTIFKNPPSSPDDTSVLGFSYDAKKIKSPLGLDSLFRPLDAYFAPTDYRAMDNVFWVDTAGNWLARWGRKKSYRLSHSIQIADRQYFKDIMNNDTLPIAAGGGGYTIQPTLSKLTGEYNVNVASKSRYYRSAAGRIIYPAMLGITADMYSIQNTILPSGYTFSIVDAKGDILFDARPGRALLSNIFVEAGDNTDLQQCVRYRYEHFYPRFTLRGREVALLTKPMSNTKYTLLVYYNLWEMQEVHFHSLGLSCFCMACILSLIALVAFINEWGKKKPSLLRLSPVNFDWLRPVPAKFGYYRHLILWIRLFLVFFLASWEFIETLLPDYEPALLLISLSFPIFISIHYYILREKYYHLAKGGTVTPPARTWLPAYRTILPFLRPAALKPLGIALLVILIYLFTSGLRLGVVLITFIMMFVFLSAITFSCQRFQLGKKNLNLKDLSAKYTWAILTGVFSITLAPAIALFMLFYKEEHNGIVRMGMLSMMQKMDDRARVIDARKNTYIDDPNPNSIQDAKFRNGIYFTDRSTDTPVLLAAPIENNFTTYSSLHNLIFQPDSTSLEALARLNAAGDGSWRFEQGSHPDRLILGHCNPMGNCKNAFSLAADPASSYPALRFFMYRLFSLGGTRLCLLFLSIIVMMIVAQRLTDSLASHVFLLRLLENFKKPDDDPFMPPDAPDQAGRPDVPDPAGLPDALDPAVGENKALERQIYMENIYDGIWEKLSTEEKYILYDFALDGFTNYKAGVLIYKLLYRDLIYVDESFQLRIHSDEFHNYLVSKDIFNQYLQNKEDIKVYKYMMIVRKQGFWQAFRIPLQVIIGAAGLFIFFTQEALTQKIIGLFTSLPFITQLLGSFFERSNGQKNNNSGSGQNTDL